MTDEAKVKHEQQIVNSTILLTKTKIGMYDSLYEKKY